MRIRKSRRDPNAPTVLPRRTHYESADDFHLARVRFISGDASVAERDKFILQLVAAFEHHKMTFNKMYRLLKEKQKETPNDSGTLKAIFGWPES